ncbi:MAG: YncE family protein, partial [Sphingobacteriales bacterium]|nr:YncE family protein [Sphingobacteriales bacterium]
GTITVIYEDAADKYTVVENVPTKQYARTIALDKATHLIYLPTADLEKPDPNQKGRPKMITGSFQILVIGK